MQKLQTQHLTRAAAVGAAYAVLSLFSSVFSLTFGVVQCRFSEALCVLPFFFPETVWGLFAGCLITNILSPYGLLDLIVGSLATLIAALLTARCRKKWLAPLPPVVLNTLLVGDAMAQILKLEEMQDSTAGLAFQGTGKLVTPMGATLLRSSAVPSGTIIGLDRQYALELVRGSEVLVEYDKLIDRQLERAAITTISGFAKLFQGAARVLEL